MTATPFSFALVERALVDVHNRLRISGHQWPEYEFTVSIDPMDGPQADAWPLRERAYFEFSYVETLDDGKKSCAFSMALPHQPFERDFPGRTEELLDVVIPLIIPTSLWTFPNKMHDAWPVVPAKMRPLLRRGMAYFRHNHEPETDEYRIARGLPRKG